jgi:uncharacterized protein involved in exopolysaccharide biosynthesis
LTSDPSLFSPARNPEYSLSRLLEILAQGRLWILATTGLFFLGAVLVAFLLPEVYTAQVTFLPQGESDSTDLIGRLASIAGAPLGGSGSYEALYDEILLSDSILDKLLDRRWESAALAREATLLEIFDIEPPSGTDQSIQLSRYLVKERLRNDVVHFYRNKLNGYMTLKVSIKGDPPLAATMANYLAGLLDEYNREFRSGKAHRQRVFVETRLAELELEQIEAENNLTEFLESNQRYTNSPTLIQRHGALQRQVNALTTVWTELRHQVELARIEEQKESVFVDILDSATTPVRRSAPDRKAIVFLGTFVGFILGLFVSLAWRQWRTGSR